MTTFKIQLKDEIRRVSINGSITLAELESKVRTMFPQVISFVLQVREEEGGPLVDLTTDEELVLEITKAQAKKPCICRVLVCEGRSRPVPVIKEPIKFETLVIPVQPVEPDVVVEEKDLHPEDKEKSEEDVVAICSICTKPLDLTHGVLQCMICENVNTCLSCEHDKKHLMIRLNTAFDEMSSEQQLSYLNCTAFGKIKTEDKIGFVNRLANADEDKERKDGLKKKLRSVKRQIRREEKKKKRAAEKKELRRQIKIGERRARIAAIAAYTVAEPEPQSVVADLPKEEPIPQVVPEVVNVEVEEVVVEREGDNFVMVNEERKEEKDWTGDWVSGIRNWTNGLTDVVMETVNTTSQVVNRQVTREEDLRINGIAFGQKLDALESMGFTDRNKNILLLVKNLASLERTVEDLTS